MKHWHVTVWSLLAALCLSPPAWAATGGSVTLPIPSVKPRTRPSGLQLNIESHWVETAGYRPVYVTVSSLAPAVADRQLTINLVPQDWSPQRSGVEFQLTLPQGAVSAQTEVAVPQTGIWNQYRITTYEDGRKLEDLTANVAIARTISSWSWTESYPAMLFIDADAPQHINSLLASSGADDRHVLPDILALRYLFPPTDEYVQTVLQADLTRRGPDGKPLPTDDEDVLTAAQRLQLVALLPPQELPSQWLNYTCLDLIFISLADARGLSRNRPEPWAAILEYVRSGGNLIVTGVGDDFTALAELDELLAVTVDSDQGPRKTTGGAAAAGNWRALDESRFGSSLSNLGSPGQVVRDYSGNVVTVEEVEAGFDGNPDLDGDGDVDQEDEQLRQQRVEAEKQKEKPSPNSELFRLRSLGAGRVVALAPEELGDASGYQWAWALNDLGPDRWRWYRRHGLSCQRSNPSFWDFLIPGVGAAPVRTFLAVITGFMIVIGPVNYFFLSRSRRLYLLLITVPLGSAIIISSLFGFAVLKDGLGTRARLRSFSQIMPDGRVTSWSRQSYYAGLAPSSGLMYPRDAAVFPIEFDASREKWRRQLIRWSDVQQLASGYLAARSTAQNLVIHSGPLEPFVELQRQGADPPRVTNRSSIQIDQLLIKDEDESFWLSDLAPGAMAPAQPLTRFDAQERYAQLLRDHRPATPVGFTAPSDRGSYRYYANNFDTAIGAPDFQSSLMENAIGAPLTTKGAAGRVYYAVTEQTPPSVPIGVKNCREVAGFHVIHGTW